ncbi:hypothetical protein MKC73_07590 [[Clostridium] innocuum]|nr:hypothetical protein [[Clostridium] innocuum]MCR0263767.1 hypothetical protein [[Clostridium] innocuum]
MNTMALRTKLNTNDEGETNGLDELDDLDAVYVDELKKSGLSENLMAQFMDISKALEKEKSEGNER